MKKLLNESSRASYWHRGAYFYAALRHCFQARSIWPLFHVTCAYHSSNAFIVLCNQALFHLIFIKDISADVLSQERAQCPLVTVY